MFASGQLLQERYQLQQPLGRSPQARQTWLATDLATDLHELVVIKLLVFTQMQWQDLKLFEREAQVLKNLNHSRIPRYRDYFLVEQQPQSQLCWWGLIQDYVPGRSLQDLLEQGTRWSEQEIRQIAEDMLQILNYLHGLSPPVLHRDIKPSNLIYHAQQVWLIDFGAVQDQVAVTGRSFTVVGTVGYAPLEQFWGRPVASSDLYALGATLIHLLTGIAPVDLPQRDLRIDFRDRISFHSDFVSWIEKLTEPALEKRFSSVQEACEALELERHSEITPVRGSIQTVCSTQSKKIQRISSCIVVKENSPQVLQIKVRESSPSTSKRDFLFVFRFVWILCMFLPFPGLALAFICALILAALVSLSKALWETPENAHAIQFDKARDRFEVTTRSFFSAKKESGIISAIRYLSITSSEVFVNQNMSYTAWAVTIRASRNYVVNWRLTEEECIWLVNEIQIWLNAKK
ncbi:serine/threonine protein kinase [Cyanobacteria bacterium FACHB-471]|nr:serine/threonine protein kinase [Cyanobacteria bacterium FACHB-471]